MVTEDDLQRATHDCLKLINTWFPERCTRTYFMPPVHMNTVKYKTWRLGDEGTAHAQALDVQAVQGTMESDWRDDEVMQRTVHCLRRLGDFLKVRHASATMLSLAFHLSRDFFFFSVSCLGLCRCLLLFLCLCLFRNTLYFTVTRTLKFVLSLSCLSQCLAHFFSLSLKYLRYLLVFLFKHSVV